MDIKMDIAHRLHEIAEVFTDDAYKEDCTNNNEMAENPQKKLSLLSSKQKGYTIALPTPVITYR